MFKNFIKKIIRKSNPNLPDWKKINKEEFLDQKGSTNILIATSAGGLLSSLVFESILGYALKRKGCNVEFLLCDAPLSACIMATEFDIKEDIFLKKGPSKICSSCSHDSEVFLKDAKFKINKLSDYIDINNEKNSQDLNSIKNINLDNAKNFKLDNIAIGEHAYAGTLRYYARTDLEKKNSNAVLRKFLESSILTKIAIEKLYSKKKFDSVVLNHGIYVPQGVIHDVSKSSGINTINYCLGTRKKTFCFCKDETYHKSLINEKNDNWENLEMNSKIESKIDKYLESRLHGNEDWIYFHNKPNFDLKNFIKKYNIDQAKPMIGLPTNVIWDAQIDFPSNFFENILNWLFYTIDYFLKNKDLQLIIRIHPAEINSTKPAKQRILDEIKKKYLIIPENIIIIPAEDNVSTYTVMQACDNVLIYGSRLGVELSALKIPVIVCGEGFIRNKDIAVDINSFEEYDNVLRKLPLDNFITEEKLKRAKKYAYHFFFRRMIKVNSIIEKPGSWPNIGIEENLEEKISNNEDHGLDSICDSIINKTDFIYEDEKNNFIN